MDPAHKALLRTHRLELSDQLMVSDTIVPFLFQEEILTAGNVEDIEAQATEKRKALRLLDVLPHRGPKAFHCFIQSLDDFSWVRDTLTHQLHANTHTPGPHANTHTPGPHANTHSPGTSTTVEHRFPASLLTKVPSDRDLSRLASRLGAEWESVLVDLGVCAESVYRCKADHTHSTHTAALSGLVQWRQRNGKKATVQKLMDSLQNVGIHTSVMEEVMTR